MSGGLRLCGYCEMWHSRPCGEGCYLSVDAPTEEDVFVTRGEVPPIVTELDRLLQFEPDMSGPLCDAIMAVRNALMRKVEPDNREWFWKIVDADGPPGLPSDEEFALQLLVEAWRRLPA